MSSIIQVRQSSVDLEWR